MIYYIMQGSTIFYNIQPRPTIYANILRQDEDRPSTSTLRSGVHKGGFRKGGFSNLCVAITSLLLNPPL